MVVSGSGFCNGGFFFFFSLAMDHGVKFFFLLLGRIFGYNKCIYRVITDNFTVYNNDLVLLTFDVGCRSKLTSMSDCLL